MAWKGFSIPGGPPSVPAAPFPGGPHFLGSYPPTLVYMALDLGLQQCKVLYSGFLVFFSNAYSAFSISKNSPIATIKPFEKKMTLYVLMHQMHLTTQEKYH